MSSREGLQCLLGKEAMYVVQSSQQKAGFALNDLNNVCPADEDQVVTDTLDHSNDSQLMLSADADGLARYGQTISTDASLSYWG